MIELRFSINDILKVIFCFNAVLLLLIRIVPVKTESGASHNRLINTYMRPDLAKWVRSQSFTLTNDARVLERQNDLALT